MAKKVRGQPKNLEARLNKVEKILDRQTQRIKLEEQLCESGEVSLRGTIWERYDCNVDLGLFSNYLNSKGMPHLLLSDTRTEGAKNELYVPAAFVGLAKIYEEQFRYRQSMGLDKQNEAIQHQQEQDMVVSEMERQGYKL